MKLVAIVGTNSDRSTNRKLLKFMAKHFAQEAEIEILEIKDLPAFNEPEEKQVPQVVAEFNQKIAQAQGVI
ncbi:NADPH-dependent FMN reductase, partial [Streptococcus sobrinus]